MIELEHLDSLLEAQLEAQTWDDLKYLPRWVVWRDHAEGGLDDDNPA